MCCVVICASYGMCKSFFAQFFVQKEFLASWKASLFTPAGLQNVLKAGPIHLLTGNRLLVTSPNIAGSKLTYLGACSSPIELKITSKHLGSKPLSLGVPVIVCVFPEPVMPYANTKPVSKKYRRANYIQYYSCSKVSSSY